MRGGEGGRYPRKLTLLYTLQKILGRERANITLFCPYTARNRSLECGQTIVLYSVKGEKVFNQT
jgi:hypothetical protein